MSMHWIICHYERNICRIQVNMITFGLFSNYKIHQTQDLGCFLSSAARECPTVFSSNYVRIPECLLVANSEHLWWNGWLMSPMSIFRWTDHFLKHFTGLKIDHMRSFQLVFCKYFFIMANCSVHLYCKNQHPQNRKILKVEINLSLLKLMYLSQFVLDLSKLGLRI